jgi:hypothetical protein
MSDDNWLMRIESGLSAHFKEEDGASRPGVQWTVGLKHGEQTYTVLVKALLADNATAETRKNEEYQMQTTMQYLNDQLQSGWHPDQEKEHTIYISNPLVPTPHGQSSAAKKPWWRFW